MQIRLLLLTGLIGLALHLDCRGAAQFVSSRGQQLTTPDGKPLLLRGINLGNWLVPEGYMFKFDIAASPRLVQTVVAELLGPDDARAFWRKFEDLYITREDIQFIKTRGFNCVRVPFNFRSFTPEHRPGVWLPRGFELLDRAVAWCKEANLWVILDMHCAPGGQTGDNIDDSWGYPWLYESKESQQRTIEIWRKIAEHYRKEPTVIGYDLLNEPIAHFFNTDRLNPLLEPVYKSLTKAIRSVDRQHLIIIEGAQWASKFDLFAPPFDPKLVYSFHKYWTDPDQKVVQDYVNFSKQYNVPLLMGESGENSDEWIAQFRATLERNEISWCFWPYKKLESASCPVSINKPRYWDEIMAYANKPRASFEQIRTARGEVSHAREAFSEFLENCHFSKVQINQGYLKALGL